MVEVSFVIYLTVYLNYAYISFFYVTFSLETLDVEKCYLFLLNNFGFL